MRIRRVSGRGVASVAVAGVLFSAAACATGGGVGGGGGGFVLPDGSPAPICTAGVYPPAPGPEPTRTPPTVVTDLPSDLQLETPGFGVPASSTLAIASTVSEDNSKLLFFAEGQSVVPGGFIGDAALVLRDRTTGTNTLIASQTDRNTSFHPRPSRFGPTGNVVFAEHGYWLPLPPDERLDGPFDHYQTQVFEWDVDTHDFTVLSLGVDGKPIASVPLGVHPQPDDPAPTWGPRNPNLSADGRYVFFTTNVRVDPAETQPPFTETKDLFRRDTVTGEIIQVNVGNYDEYGINANRGRSGVEKYDVSDDGRYVVFKTLAVGALAETGMCGQADLLFFRDIQAETTTLVSHDNLGKQRFAGGTEFMSADGRYVIWESSDPGMPNLPAGTDMIWDRLTGQNDWFLPEQDGTPAGHSENDHSYTGDFPMSVTPDMHKMLIVVTDDGPFSDGVIPGDGDGNHEVVLFDRSANTVRRVSQLPDGTSVSTIFDELVTMAWATLSPDGSRLFFVTSAALLPGDTYPGRALYSMAL
ncbi:MAG TPA: hypothetical protein VJM33_14650 [Microthrixaceae bacterium]|nr:hypothetical protein [Microthrixaceae bacterium]